MDNGEKDRQYGTRLEGAFFWFLFGGTGFACILLTAAIFVDIDRKTVHKLVYAGSAVLAVFGAVTRSRPKYFP